MTFTKLEQEYLVFILLIKCVGFVELSPKTKIQIDDYEIEKLINEFSIYFNINLNKENFVIDSKLIIKKYFPYFIEKLKTKELNPEISITGEILNQIDNCRISEKKTNNYDNLQIMFNESENGKFYRLFFYLRYIIEQYNERTGIVCGETIYHSLARLSAEGVEKYFEYFKMLCENNLVNFKNQNQENSNFNRMPCIYWLLISKEELLYFNYLIKNKDIKMNHISGNEHGPSAFKFIMDDILSNQYWNRKLNKNLPLDEEHRNILFETLYNIVLSNYSVSYDKDKLYDVIAKNLDNEFIIKIIDYLTSEEGIKKQYENNQYPIYIGKKIDSLYNEEKLNSELNELIRKIKNIEAKKLVKNNIEN